MPEFAVILPAAGNSSRLRGFDRKKPFVDLAGESVWKRTVNAFIGRRDVTQILLVLADSDRGEFLSRFSKDLHGIELVVGGASRAESVSNGLQLLRDTIDFVAVHDAARPLVRQDVIDAVFAGALATGAAIPGVPITSTVKRIDERGQVEATIDRSKLKLAQTPQTFARNVLLDAYAQMQDRLHDYTDEAAIVEATGYPVTVTEGSWDNIKITTAEDFQFAEMILAGRGASSPG
ncbi:MAG: 2-C-methyl-D-erythritol 4-phosphate cytidylyltransferase [Planctomycetaceae bacterium]|jgi:2-C-methyl-D-erythritol 4-phosphate cytidylyltransferase